MTTIDNSPDKVPSTANQTLVKIQVYVTPDMLDIAVAIARQEKKQLGTVHREIWEAGLPIKAEASIKIMDYKEKLELQGEER
jgi:hypothetical protein